jgi:hypothetical protein
MRFHALFFVLLALVLPVPGRELWAQSSEAEIQVLAAALTHAVTNGLIPAPEPSRREVFIERKARIVLDPVVLGEKLSQGPEDWNRARRVAQLVKTEVAPLRSMITCLIPKRPGCQLTVDHLFQLGTPRISNDTATVLVVHRWKQEGLRDPMPMVASEVLLTRTMAGWKVTGQRLMVRS